MRSLTAVRRIALGVALIGPLPLYGQAITQADLVGTWRRAGVQGIYWDSAKGVSVGMYEQLVMLGSDRTYTTDYRYTDETGAPKAGGWGFGNLAPKGQWTLSGDTLIVRYLPSDTLEIVGIKNKNKPGKWLLGGDPPEDAGDTVWQKRSAGSNAGPALALLARHGDTLSTAWLVKRIKGNDTSWIRLDDWTPQEFERIDPSKPRAPLTPPPATLKPADLAGTWVAKEKDFKGQDFSDTLTLRADGTWAGEEGAIEPGGCALAKPSEASNTGKWYLGPANTIVLIDAKQRRVCSTAQRWRGPVFKLQGQQILVANPKLTYDRVNP